MHGRIWSHFLWIVCSLVAGGCDPVRTTSQATTLQIVDSASGRPVDSACVSLRLDYATIRPLSKETDMTPEEWQAYKREVWDRSPWLRGVTDKHGQVSIDVSYTSIDRTRGATPPSGKDFVTGKPCLIRVKAGELPEEEMSVVMSRDTSVKGRSCTVTIMEIEEPRYVQVNSGRTNEGVEDE
jgi:hypothetical protein